MDKQLIERIVGEEIDAMEFEEAVTESYGKQRTQRIVERCVARIDAERGKKAVARIGDVWQIDWIGRGPIAPIIEAHGLKVGDFLYAAADIPECWALVPVEPTDAMLKAGWVRPQIETFPPHAGIYRAMLAAAQGEK